MVWAEERDAAKPERHHSERGSESCRIAVMRRGGLLGQVGDRLRDQLKGAGSDQDNVVRNLKPINVVELSADKKAGQGSDYHPCGIDQPRIERGGS